ncbi:MAG: phosphatidylglycerol lysyltransferase [Treponemataceae bacterium]|nr:phosphatidylglycerol lysyltransferase [Treponemataceae bacterium]
MTVVVPPEWSTSLPVNSANMSIEGSLTNITAEVQETIQRCILSASGWRGVFAIDGNEESRVPHISRAYQIISYLAANLFAEHLQKEHPETPVTVVVGVDTRPTGPAIASCIIRALLQKGCHVRYTHIIAAPEIMAYSRIGGEKKEVAGFIYVSASHNPIGHNGIKFGKTDGGVLSATEMGPLITEFRRRVENPEYIEKAIQGLTDHSYHEVFLAVLSESKTYKEEALAAYEMFTRHVISGTDDSHKQAKLFKILQEALTTTPVGILIDFNGSARTCSIDRSFLENLGCKVEVMHEKPGAIAHRIVPEGESLDPCRKRLEELHAEDSTFIVGYVPDCDGDRGNLVIWDEQLQQARSLEAQEVFSLCCLAELSYLVWSGELQYDNKGNAKTKAAVAINDPTSMRIDRIARVFDVSVFRAEVGEAHVVNLARQLREKGYVVRFLGEGAAGGNITHPAAVRDPINTVGAILKLLLIRNIDGVPGLFDIWKELSEQQDNKADTYSLSHILATIPSFVTTSAYNPEAILRVKTQDHGRLKAAYQEIFYKEWEIRRKELAERYGIVSWEALGYNGTEERRNLSRFEEAGRGGLKIVFKNQEGKEIAFIWMRGSGTEPVFRIMADTEGKDPRMERDLLFWQRKMVEEADVQAQRR